MQKTVYEDYKYSVQDTARIYVGCKYTFGEFLEEEEIQFKFRLVMQKYILPEADPEDTLESHLYYLAPDSFLVKIYRQMKARVKVNVIEEKKPLFGGGMPSALRAGFCYLGNLSRAVTSSSKERILSEEAQNSPPMVSI